MVNQVGSDFYFTCAVLVSIQLFSAISELLDDYVFHFISYYIVTDLLRALLGNGSVNKPQQRETVFYEVRIANVATQGRGKQISAVVSRHATIRTT
jgi:hypothetical protein